MLYGSLESGQGPEMEEERLSEHLTVRRIPAIRVTAPLRRVSRFTGLQRRFQGDHRLDPFTVVHAHQIWPVGLAGAALARRAKARFIITEHGSVLDDRKSAIKRWAMRRACASAAGILAASRELVEVVQGIGVPRHKVSAVPNAIWPEDFQVADEKRDVRERLGLPQQAFVAMTVRRLVPKNGVQYAVRAVPLCLKAIPGFLLVVVGRGPLQRELERLAAELGVRDRVRFVGAVDNKEVKYYMRAADLGVFPSLAEATSIAALEFMAAGTPVAASRVGGLPEIVEDGQTGFLFDIGFTGSTYEDPGLPPAAIESVADVIVRASTADLQNVGRAAAHNVNVNFSWRSYAERLEAQYYGPGQ